MSDDKKNIHDFELEIKALKTIMGESPYSGRLYGFLKPEHFHYRASKALFNRLQELMVTLEEFPSWRMLISDSKLEQGVQAALQDGFEKSAEATTKGDLDYLVKNLSELAYKRAIHASLFQGEQDLYDAGKSAKEIAGELGAAIIGLADDDDPESEICMGVDYNEFTEKLFLDTLNGVAAREVLPSGYKSFDERSFGFLPGDLVLIGASTGGGKSTMALNMLNRQYKMGKRVVMASYEMSYNQLHARHMSMLTEIPHDRIRANALTAAERRVYEAAWREFNLHGKRTGNGFWISCPTKDQTVYEVGYKYKEKKPHIYIFDYINFLKTKNKSKATEQQWQQLGEISREGKILARRHDCVVVMLMQIDEEHKIRYARAIQDHADWAWGWVYDEEAKTNGFVNVKQLKARSGLAYDFPLVARFDVCQFRDPDEEDMRLHYTDEQFAAIIEEARQHGLMPAVQAPPEPIAAPEPPAPAPEDPAVVAFRFLLSPDALAEALMGAAQGNDLGDAWLKVADSAAIQHLDPSVKDGTYVVTLLMQLLAAEKAEEKTDDQKRLLELGADLVPGLKGRAAALSDDTRNTLRAITAKARLPK